MAERKQEERQMKRVRLYWIQTSQNAEKTFFRSCPNGKIGTAQGILTEDEWTTFVTLAERLGIRHGTF